MWLIKASEKLNCACPRVDLGQTGVIDAVTIKNSWRQGGTAQPEDIEKSAGKAIGNYRLTASLWTHVYFERNYAFPRAYI